MGGGLNELLQSDPTEKKQVAFTWLKYWWLILPFNLLLALLVSIVPDFEHWYVMRQSSAGHTFEGMQTHERWQWGLAFIPCVKYFASEIGDLAMAILFTRQQMMPFRDEAGIPIYGKDAPWTATLVYMYVHCTGALVKELLNLFSAIFDGLEPGKRIGDAIFLILEGVFDLTLQARKQAVKWDEQLAHAGGHHGSTHPPTPARRISRTDSGSLEVNQAAVVDGWKKIENAAVQLNQVLFEMLYSLSIAKGVKANNVFDVTMRVFALVTLSLANQYSEDDYLVQTVGVFHKESIFGYTVALLWIGEMKVLKVSSKTGAFVFMLTRMGIDVLRWFIIYIFGLVAIGAGMFVLFHNQRAAIGTPYGALEDECERVQNRFSSMQEGTLFLLQARQPPPCLTGRTLKRVHTRGAFCVSPTDLIASRLHHCAQITLEGGGYWTCFRQSFAEYPGMVLFGNFMIIVVIMLLSMLIAMMAQTFKVISSTAFDHYSFEFAKVLVAQRCRPGSIAVPLNLVSVPYHVLHFLLLIFQRATALAKSPQPKDQAGTASDKLGRATNESGRSSAGSAIGKFASGAKRLEATEINPRRKLTRTSGTRFGTTGNLGKMAKDAQTASDYADGRDPEVWPRRHGHGVRDSNVRNAAPEQRCSERS